MESVCWTEEPTAVGRVAVDATSEIEETVLTVDEVVESVVLDDEVKVTL